jgi:hypothetical protein
MTRADLEFLTTIRHAFRMLQGRVDKPRDVRLTIYCSMDYNGRERVQISATDATFSDDTKVVGIELSAVLDEFGRRQGFSKAQEVVSSLMLPAPMEGEATETPF